MMPAAAQIAAPGAGVSTIVFVSICQLREKKRIRNWSLLSLSVFLCRMVFMNGKNNCRTSTSIIRASSPFNRSNILKLFSMSCSFCFTSVSVLGIEVEVDEVEEAADRLACTSVRSFIISTI